MGIEPAKLPALGNRLDTLQIAITGMANINGYHQLGLLTSE